jgi:hypothetical protein
MLNKEWHKANPMPKHPSLEQRIKWHVEHARECQCREIPKSIAKEHKKKRH